MERGQQAQFTYSGQDDANLRAHSGQRCEVLYPLSNMDADLDEVGPMYRIRFADGFTCDAFNDELEAS